MGNMRSDGVFLRHAPCPDCGSRDNLAIYTDHEWCFGCHRRVDYKEKLHRGIIFKKGATSFDTYLLTNDLPDVAVRWLRKYGITDEEIDRYRIQWEPNKELLVFPFYEGDKLVLTNSRYFGTKEDHPKYLTKGSRDHRLIWGKADSPVCLMVEDAVSAIKVGRSYASYPILGCNPEKALIWLSKRFSRLGVWLDPDKAKDASKAVLKGMAVASCPVFRITTPDDPKVYDDKNISEIVELSRK